MLGRLISSQFTPLNLHVVLYSNKVVFSIIILIKLVCFISQELKEEKAKTEKNKKEIVSLERVITNEQLSS